MYKEGGAHQRTKSLCLLSMCKLYGRLSGFLCDGNRSPRGYSLYATGSRRRGPWCQYLLALRFMPPVHFEVSQRNRYCQGNGCPENGGLEKEGEKGPYPDS